MRFFYYLILFVFALLGGLAGLMLVWRLTDLDARADWYASGWKGTPPQVDASAAWEFFAFGLLGLFAAYFIFRWMLKA